jgi:hypothetical protein
MLDLLKKENTPFFLTLLIGVFGYLLNMLIQVYTDTNYLEYSFKKEHSEVSNGQVFQDIVCNIQNINGKNAYHDVVLHYGFDSNQESYKIDKPRIISISPSWNILDTVTKNIEMNINEYKIPVINSFNTYELRMQLVKTIDDENYPKIYLKSSDNIVLGEKSFITRLIKNKVTVITILVVIALISIFWYIYKIKNY